MRNGHSRLCNAKWRFATVICAAVLSSCSNGGEADAMLVDYQRYLAESLGLEAPTPQSPDNIDAFPAHDDRLLAIPETREGLLNVYALRDCQITQLVAQRNNQLGRVASASQRWLSSQSPEDVFPAFFAAKKRHDTLRETIVAQCR